MLEPIHNFRATVRAWPRAVRLVTRNWVMGAGLGVLVAGGMIATNTCNLRTLIYDTSDSLTPVLLLAGGFATLFGGLVAAAAVMRLPYDE